MNLSGLRFKIQGQISKINYWLPNLEGSAVKNFHKVNSNKINIQIILFTWGQYNLSEGYMEPAEIPACTAFGVHDTVLKCISTDKGIILDAAAGHGALSCKLQKMGFQVYSLDIKPSQFQCKTVICQAADLNVQIPFNDAFFDGVISVETIEHLENPWHFIREIKRVLKPQGFVIITTPNITSIFSRIYFLFSKNFILFTKKDLLNKHHITPMTRWMLEGILESEGFEIQKICCSPGYIPYLDFYFKTNHLLFGHILVVVAKKP